MNAKVSVFVICVKAIIYLLLYNLHDCTFKASVIRYNGNYQHKVNQYMSITKVSMTIS